MQELTDLFTLEKVNKAGAVFDTKKLEWMNAQYLRNADPDSLLPQLQVILHEHHIEVSDERAKGILTLLRERITFLNEVPGFGAYMFSDDYVIDEEYKEKHWTADSGAIIASLLPIMKGLEEFNHTTINDAIGAFTKENGIASKLFIHPLRMILTGKPVGAGLYETMEMLGKEVCIRRIERFLSQEGT
jgi:glutamyl-tRNA synthetase